MERAKADLCSGLIIPEFDICLKSFITLEAFGRKESDELERRERGLEDDGVHGAMFGNLLGCDAAAVHLQFERRVCALSDTGGDVIVLAQDSEDRVTIDPSHRPPPDAGKRDTGQSASQPLPT